MSHLKDVNEKYSEHMLCALKYACRMMGASIALVIHGVIPDIFISTASNTMKSILNEVDQRKQKAKCDY